jgi:hypothetical protein
VAGASAAGAIDAERRQRCVDCCCVGSALVSRSGALIEAVASGLHRDLQARLAEGTALCPVLSRRP